MRKYSCKTCDAELYWDAKIGALKCEYCDSTFDPSEFEDVKNKSQEAQVADENDTVTDESEGLEFVKYQCTECGAEIVTAKGTIATTCAYCGHAISISSKIVGDFKPDALIPFTIDIATAKEIYEEYCKKSFLTPKAFKDKENLKKMKGLYVPFWLHSFKDSAHAIVDCENTKSRRRGDDKIITHYMYKVHMDSTGTFDKIPTDALSKMDNELMDAIEPFDYNHLEDFNPAFMAGFYAEEKNESSDDNFERAHERATDTMHKCILHEAGNYQTKRIVSYDDNTNDYKSNYVMLPVWLFSTEYKNKKYTFAINGDTGHISGKLPIDANKLIYSLLAAFAGSQLLALIVRLLMLI